MIEIAPARQALFLFRTSLTNNNHVLLTITQSFCWIFRILVVNIDVLNQIKPKSFNMKLSKLTSMIAVGMIGVFALSSCSSERGLTIEKRKYRGGYHVQWHGKSKTNQVKEATVTKNDQAPTLMESLQPAQLQASADNNVANCETNQVEFMMTQDVVSKETTDAAALSAAPAMSKKEFRKFKREVRSTLKEELSSSSSSVAGDDLPDWLIAVFCIILPPLAVGLRLGVGTDFWINLLLTLLFWLPGVIHAFVVIF